MNLSKFSEILSELMFERNINAKLLAKNTGLTAATISRYKNQDRMPTVKNLIILADYFNVSIDFLLGREQENPNLTFRKCPPFSEQIVLLANFSKPSFYDFYTDLKIPESTFFEWKNGSSMPTLESIKKIADYFDWRFDFVIGREN